MSECKPKWTLPGTIKRRGDPTLSNSTVCCSDTYCTKTFESAEVYARELSVYEKQLPYVPRMISHDPETRSITVERVGNPLAHIWNTDIPGSSIFLWSNAKYDARIRALRKRLFSDTGLHHNDIQYKNVLTDGTNLYLIDFERSGTVDDDGDLNGILSHHSSRKWTVLMLGVLLAVFHCLARRQKKPSY